MGFGLRSLRCRRTLRHYCGRSHYCCRDAVVAARVDGSPAEAFIEGLGTRAALGVKIVRLVAEGSSPSLAPPHEKAADPLVAR